MAAVLRRGGGLGVAAGLFLLGRTARRPINFERLGLMLVAGGALALLLDHLHERTEMQLDGVAIVVGNKIDDLHETLTTETQTLHRDICTVDKTARRVTRAAIELGHHIGKETEQRAADLRLTEQMSKDFMSPDGGSKQERGDG